MSFGESIKTCFSKYVVFKGRASRSELWWFVLFYAIIMLIAGIVDSLVGWDVYDLSSTTINGQPVTVVSSYHIGWVQGVAALVFILPLLAVQVRRLHDRDTTGWMWWLNLLNCLCGLGAIILIFGWYIQPTKPGPNRFGPEPGTEGYVTA